ncbi:MAG: putative RNA methyltransferase [Streptosporangiaceae bacterium]
MLDDVLGWLRCPHCLGHLTRADGSLLCTSGHNFDIARQGYVALLHSGTPGGGGDTAAMVSARQAFLAAGHFAAIAATLADAAAAAIADAKRPGRRVCMVDIGAGTGYYLAAALERVPGAVGMALDVSKHALRRAARAHPRIGAVRCDAWHRLPVADGAADVILNVFAPRRGAELRRILRPDGRLLVVTPGPEHLTELTGPLALLSVDERKCERLEDNLGPYFSLDGESEHRGVMTLGRHDVAAVAAMGPTAWHAGQAAMAERIAGLPETMPVTRAVILRVLRPRR